MNSPAHTAFSLVEVTLALGIAAFAFVTTFALLPVGQTSNQVAMQQTQAANLATALAADLREVPTAAAVVANPTYSTHSPRYGIDVTAPGSTVYLDASGAPCSVAQARFQAAIVLGQPSAGQRTATAGSVTVSWPPGAAVAVGSVAIYLALDRN